MNSSAKSEGQCIGRKYFSKLLQGFEIHVLIVLMIAHCSEFSVECDTVASLSIEKSKENLNIFDFELGSDGLCCGEACNLDVDISTVTD